MSSRSYDQLCPVAVSLDLVGDRWTLLLLRDLLWHGPMRFGELDDRNPGLSTSLLTTRLRELEAAGLVERVGAARTDHYRLTAEGLRIRPVVDAFYEFGAPLLQRVPLRLELLDYVVHAAVRERRRELLRLEAPIAVRFAVDGWETVVAAAPGRLELSDTATVDATLRCSREAFVALLGGVTSVSEAAESGVVTVVGDPAAAQAVADLLGGAAAAARA